MDGILIVDKPKGATSHDIVDFVRRRFKIEKVGHAGTLDPQATGVLVVLIGRFTKRSQEFIIHDKEYAVCLTLGILTDSYDSQGKIIKRQEVASYTRQQLDSTFGQFMGEIKQIPPMFSALKYKGKRLYSLARKGIEIKRKRRQVHIYKLQIIKFNSPDIHFVVHCSKGTYIRSLCVDIAKRLGCPGYASQLRRVRSGPFSINQAITIERLRQLSAQQLQDFLHESY